MNQEQTRVPVEVVAAITAAIAAVIDQPVGSFAITNIQPVQQPAPAMPSAWAKAGLIQSHLARAAFGSRSR
ncbi:MAG: hypothetical protein ACOY94_27170 [Bacillota bacterium]